VADLTATSLYSGLLIPASIIRLLKAKTSRRVTTKTKTILNAFMGLFAVFNHRLSQTKIDFHRIAAAF
jgi:hypothetical protein